MKVRFMIKNTHTHCEATYTLSPSCRWTGSNTNPVNNDGQGTSGTDYSNIVLLRGQNFAEGTPEVGTFGHWANNYPAHLDDNMTFLGWNRADRESLATSDNGRCRERKRKGNKGEGVRERKRGICCNTDDL